VAVQRTIAWLSIGNIDWIGNYFLDLKFTSNEMIYISYTMQAILNGIVLVLFLFIKSNEVFNLMGLKVQRSNAWLFNVI